MAVYHKPVGVISSIGDPHGRPNLKEVIENNKILEKMHPVGRLDADTSGLLLFCSDGKFTNYLLSPTARLQREYRAVVVGEVDFTKLRAQLTAGVQTTDGKIKGVLLDSSSVSEQQKTEWFPNGIKIYHTEVKPPEENEVLEDFQTGEIELTLNGAMLLRQPLSIVNLTVTEGKYRMVRRILHNCGHSVVSLQRVRYGEIRLSSEEVIPPENEGEEPTRVINDLPESAVRPLLRSERRWIDEIIRK